MITGEVGTGKTAAVRAAVTALDPAGHNVIYIGNPATGVRGILAAAVTALGGRPVHGTAALAVQAWNVLAGEAAERGRTPVLIIDEAHLLDHGQLSPYACTNHDMDSSTPFATVLVGQPTLRHNIKLGVLAALDQRITVRYQMKGMTPDETAAYIRHHLEEAGRTADLFTDDAVAQIHQAARGKPRTVNNICVAALIATAVAARTSSTTQPPEPPSPRSPRQTDHPADTLNTSPARLRRAGLFNARTCPSPKTPPCSLQTTPNTWCAPVPSSSACEVFTDLGMSSRRKLDRARPAIRLPSRALGRLVGVAPCALPSHDWPLALCSGGYERGPLGVTIAGMQPSTRNHLGGQVMAAYAGGLSAAIARRPGTQRAAGRLDRPQRDRVHISRRSPAKNGKRNG